MQKVSVKVAPLAAAFFAAISTVSAHAELSTEDVYQLQLASLCAGEPPIADAQATWVFISEAGMELEAKVFILDGKGSIVKLTDSASVAALDTFCSTTQGNLACYVDGNKDKHPKGTPICE